MWHANSLANRKLMPEFSHLWKSANISSLTNISTAIIINTKYYIWSALERKKYYVFLSKLSEELSFCLWKPRIIQRLRNSFKNWGDV